MIRYIDNISPYSFDMVNCFERPLAIMLENENKNLGSLFLICNSLAMSYYDKQYVTNNGIYFESVDIFLKLILKKEIVRDNLEKYIDKYLSRGKTVLVPGNLKYLFYSEHYMENNWKHLFLVTGYDTGKGIMHVIDNEHVSYSDENITYKNFVLKQEILQECFDNYKWDKNRYIYSLEGFEFEIKNTLIEILDTIKKKICNRFYIQNYIISLVKESNGSDEIMEIEKLLINSTKYKFVLYNELINILKFYEVETYGLNELNRILYDTWIKKILITIKKERKNNYKNIFFDDFDEINLLEDRLLSIINRVHIDIIDKNIFDEKKEEVHYINNEDNIIKVENKIVNFNFNTGRIYNSWKTDKCPKYIIKSQLKSNGKFRLKCYCQKKNTPFNDGYQFGIYIKTKTDKKYFLGCDMLNQGIISILGVKELLKKQLDFLGKEFFFEVYFICDKLIFEIGCNDKSLIIGSIIIDETYEVGLFCKTWGDCKKLNITFKDIDFKEIV